MSAPVTTPAFMLNRNFLSPNISLGRLRLLDVSLELKRLDPEGVLQAAIVAALNRDPDLAARIVAATFPNEDPSPAVTDGADALAS